MLNFCTPSIWTKVCFQKRRKKVGNSAHELSPAIREKMKKAFGECHKAVLACEDETGRKRCELFRELPDKRVCVCLFLEI